MPSYPRSTQTFASSAVMIPLRSIGPLMKGRMSSRYFQLYHIRRGSTRYFQAPRAAPAGTAAEPSTARARASAKIPIVQVALVPRRLLVGGHDDRCCAVGLKQFDLIAGCGEILNRIELRPARSVGTRGNLLDRDARTAGEGQRSARGAGALVHPCVAIGVQIPLRRAGGDEDGVVHLDAQQLSRGVDAGGGGAWTLDQVHPLKGLAVPPERELRIAAVRHVVVVGQLHVREADRLEVEGRHHLVHARHAPMVSEGARVELRAEQRRSRENARQAQ
jgi:hypothetical protein